MLIVLIYMTAYESFRGLLCLIPICLFFTVNLFGMRYNAVSEKYNKSYLRNHSITGRNGRFWFSIPGFISSKVDNTEIEKAKKNYNRLSVCFWISVVIVVMLFIIK